MKEPRIIKQMALPPAPYPPTPVIKRQRIEIPEDAVIIELEPYKYQEEKRGIKALRVRTQPIVASAKQEGKI